MPQPQKSLGLSLSLLGVVWVGMRQALSHCYLPSLGLTIDWGCGGDGQIRAFGSSVAFEAESSS